MRRARVVREVGAAAAACGACANGGTVGVRLRRREAHGRPSQSIMRRKRAKKGIKKSWLTFPH